MHTNVTKYVYVNFRNTNILIKVLIQKILNIMILQNAKSQENYRWSKP